MHRNNTNIFIGTHKSAYRDPPIGKLKTSLVRIMFSLQQRFDSNSQAGLSIGVDYLPAIFASEQGIVGRMPLPNSTAVGTPLGGMPAIHYVQRNVTVKTTLLKDGFEFRERDTHDSSVEPPSFGFESGKILYGNLRLKALCNLDNLPDNLPKVGFYKITFCGLEFCKFLFGSKGLKNCPSGHNLLPSCPDVLAKIGLIEDFAIRGDNRYGEVLGVDVYSKDIFSERDFLFLGKIGYNLPFWEKPVSFANPAVSQKGGKSLEAPVLFDGNRNSLARHNSEFDKEAGFGREGLAVSGDIELDADGIDMAGFLMPCITDKGANDLDVERGAFLAG